MFGKKKSDSPVLLSPVPNKTREILDVHHTDTDRRLLAFDPATLIRSWGNYDGRGYLCGAFRGSSRLEGKRGRRTLVSFVKEAGRGLGDPIHSLHDGLALLKNSRGLLLDNRISVSFFHSPSHREISSIHPPSHL